MRLSRDERKLLAFYAKKAGQPQGNCQISDDEPIKLLKFSDKKHLHDIKKKLMNRELISFTHLEKFSDFLNVNGQRKKIEVVPNVTVTKEGFDLGIKCNSIFGLSLVWLNEYYKWLMLIATIILVTIGIVTFLKLK